MSNILGKLFLGMALFLSLSGEAEPRFFVRLKSAGERAYVIQFDFGRNTIVPSGSYRSMHSEATEDMVVFVAHPDLRAGSQVRMILRRYYSSQDAADRYYHQEHIGLSYQVDGLFSGTVGPQLMHEEARQSPTREKTHYRQELEVFVDGKALIDPVNGSSVFHLSFWGACVAQLAEQGSHGGMHQPVRDE